MRIAINHTRMSAAGGVERYVYALAVRLARAGHEVHFVCARADGPPPEVQLPGRIVVRLVRGFRAPRALKVLSFARASERLIRAEGFDLVHGFSKTWRQDVYSDGSGTAEAYRRFRVEAAPNAAARCLRYLDPSHLAVVEVERRRFADPGLARVIAMSRLVEQQILAAYPALAGRTLVIYNGVDIDVFHPARAAALRGEARAEFGLDPRDLALLFLGNDYKRKGLDLALAAMARLSTDGPRPVLLVAGRENREGLFRRLSAGCRVRWLGPRTDVERLYAASDAFVFPSRYDVFGNVVLEAMASGVPPVVSGLSGAAEVVTDGEDGFVVPDPADAGGLAVAIWRLADPAVRRAVGATARARAEALSWERHFERVEAVYREVKR